MNLKTSYFNAPLFKLNLKRFWWIGAGVMLGFLTVALLSLFDYQSTDGYEIMNVLLIGVAGILPAIMFSYLNNSGSVTCLHALPVKRRAHFLTGIVTIYTLILVPAIIAYAVGVLYCVVKEPIEINNLIELFPALIVCITIAISAGTLGSMITGNTIAAIAFGILLFAFPFYAEAVFKGFLSLNLYGMWRVEYFSLENFSPFKVNNYMICLFAVACAGLFVGWLLYKNRKLETNGDIISFKFLKPIFIAGVSLFAGLIGYFYLGIFFADNIFLMLPFGILGAVVSYMLAKKAFTVKGIWKPILIYAVFVCAVWATVTFDLTGFERRVPDISDIESIDMVDVDSFDARDYYYMHGYYDDIYIEDYRYYDETDFENIINFHKYKIENRNELGSEPIYIVYNFKNGRTLKRIYYASLIEDKKYLEPIYRTEQKQKINHIWLVRENPVIDITISDDRLKNDTKIYEILVGDSEKAKMLLDALKKDVSEASYEDIVSYKNSLTQVQISFQRILKDKDGNEFVDYRDHRTTDSFGIPESYTRTTALLKEWGFYDALYKPEDISYIELEFDYNSNENVKIANAEEIEELYQFVSDSKYISGMTREYSYSYNIRATFFDAEGRMLFDSHNLGVSMLPLPQFVENEAKEFANKHGINNGTNIIVEKAEMY